MATSEEMNKATTTAATHSAGAKPLCLPCGCACRCAMYPHSPVPDRRASIATMGLPPGTGEIRPGVMGDHPGEAFNRCDSDPCAYMITAEPA
jgi:hypothetical protein